MFECGMVLGYGYLKNVLLWENSLKTIDFRTQIAD